MVLWTLAPSQQAMAISGSWSTSMPAVETQTANATPHTKGAWNEWIASTSSAWAGFSVQANANSIAATDTSMLMDVGVGAAGVEVPILTNLPMGCIGVGMQFLVPLRVPSGSRVAARIQAAQVSDTLAIRIAPWSGTGMSGPGASYQTATTYGADTSTSRGVTVTADTGTNNTFGTWTEISSATSGPIRAMILGVQLNGDLEVSSTGWRLEVGFGGSGVEVPVAVMSNNFSSGESMAYSLGTQHPPALLTPTVAIPEGARLVARLATGASTTTTPAVDVVIIGLR